MPVCDYVGSFRRHFDDAEFLFVNGKQPNAGQLYGFAAECGVKALLVGLLIIEVDSTGDIKKKASTGQDQIQSYRQHIDKLLGTLATLKTDRVVQAYLALIPNISNFHDWTTNHRYWSENSIPTSLLAWQNASKEVCIMIDTARKDGKI